MQSIGKDSLTSCFFIGTNTAQFFVQNTSDYATADMYFGYWRHVIEASDSVITFSVQYEDSE